MKKNSRREYIMNNYTPEEQKELLKTAQVIDSKIQLFLKRLVLGVIICVLFIILIIDSIIVKQTIKARKYIATTASFTDYKDMEKENIVRDCLYEFKDKEGNRQEIVFSIPENTSPKDKINIKYNEKNPEEFYEESAIFNKWELIWYVAKIVIEVLLIMLFFNKKLLSKFRISVRSRKR